VCNADTLRNPRSKGSISGYSERSGGDMTAPQGQRTSRRG
jgi:hypothetical protein